jgi:RES domain-containing protein
MGLAKSEWIDAMERGWSAPDTAVCPDCVDDAYLKELVADNATHSHCDYCGRQSDDLIASDMEVLVEAVWATVWTYYCDPAQGVPYDGGFVIPPIDFDQVLYKLGFGGNDQMFQDMAGTDVNCGGFVPAANGDWSGSHEHQVVAGAWRLFSHDVKHRTRFHFYRPAPTNAHIGPYELPVSETLPALATHLRSVERVLPGGTTVYRVRQRKRGDDWPPDSGQMGAPPDEVVTAGRMNPAGIAYLYTAFDPVTAMKEVRASRRGGAQPFLAEFRLTRDVVVFDLTAFPPKPSIFDVENKHLRDTRILVEEFSKSISQPVTKNGSEHIEYVPSQVVCEYLAQAFELRDGVALGGLIYASAVHPGGKNLVLFPSHRHFQRDFQGVEFVSARPHPARN